MGDRIQLQQVMLNLIINSIEAMSAVSDSPRELWVSSEKLAAMSGESDQDGLGFNNFASPDATHLEVERGTSNAERQTHAYWFQWRIQARCWIVSLAPFTPPSLKAWEWGCRSAVLLLKLMEGGYGRGQMCRKALYFNSRYRLLMTKSLTLMW